MYSNSFFVSFIVFFSFNSVLAQESKAEKQSPLSSQSEVLSNQISCSPTNYPMKKYEQIFLQASENGLEKASEQIKSLNSAKTKIESAIIHNSENTKTNQASIADFFGKGLSKQRQSLETELAETNERIKDLEKRQENTVELKKLHSEVQKKYDLMMWKARDAIVQRYKLDHEPAFQTLKSKIERWAFENAKNNMNDKPWFSDSVTESLFPNYPYGSMTIKSASARSSESKFESPYTIRLWEILYEMRRAEVASDERRAPTADYDENVSSGSVDVTTSAKVSLDWRSFAFDIFSSPKYLGTTFNSVLPNKYVVDLAENVKGPGSLIKVERDFRHTWYDSALGFSYEIDPSRQRKAFTLPEAPQSFTEFGKQISRPYLEFLSPENQMSFKIAVNRLHETEERFFLAREELRRLADEFNKKSIVSTVEYKNPQDHIDSALDLARKKSAEIQSRIDQLPIKQLREQESALKLERGQLESESKEIAKQYEQGAIHLENRKREHELSKVSAVQEISEFIWSAPPSAPIGVQNYSIPLRLQSKEILPAYKRALFEDLISHEKIPQSVITRAFLWDQIQAYQLRHQTGFAFSKDQIARLEAWLRALTKSTGPEAENFKLKYEADLEKTGATPLKYNKDAVTVVDIAEKGKLQCFSGSVLHQMLCRNAQMETGKFSSVMIFEPGHVLPGLMKRSETGSWHLYGIETTTSGESVVDYGRAADLTGDLVVVDSEFFFLRELFKQYMVDHEEFRKYAMNWTNKAYGISSDRITARPEGTSFDIRRPNQTLFSFGEANVQDGDIDRKSLKFEDRKNIPGGPGRLTAPLLQSVVKQTKIETLDEIRDVPSLLEYMKAQPFLLPMVESLKPQAASNNSNDLYQFVTGIIALTVDPYINKETNAVRAVPSDLTKKALQVFKSDESLSFAISTLLTRWGFLENLPGEILEYRLFGNDFSKSLPEKEIGALDAKFYDWLATWKEQK